MNVSEKTSPDPYRRSIGNFKLFLALSRTPHGLLDMATPCFAALLWLGEAPPVSIILIGLITTFSGYTAVYALNDIVDYKIDRKKLGGGQYCNPESYLDALMIRHPMAQECLSLQQGLLWAVGWAIVAGVGAWLLNPVCLLIFALGCFFEIIYCLLWRISPLRTIVSGAVKTSGPIAGIFAVDPNPAPVFVTVLFLALFFWEIGGQNIPADWTDMESDRRLEAKTIPVRFSLNKSRQFIMICICFSIVLIALAFQLSRSGPGIFSAAFAVLAGIYLLFFPAIRLYYSKSRSAAMTLFNKSSHYPVALFIAALIHMIV